MKKEISVDITDEIAEWALKDLVKLLGFLEKNGFSKIYFDGNNAVLYALKIPKDD